LFTPLKSLLIMTEEKDINTETVEVKEQVESEVVPTTEKASVDSNSAEHAARKPSNLRGRWKRNSASGTATIKESRSKVPMEINTVKIEKAERLDKTAADKKQENNNKRFEKKSCSCSDKESCSCGDKGKCCCCSFLGKIKNFVLALFGFKSKKNHKFHGRNNGNRGRRHYGNRRRNYHSNSRSNQSR